MSDPVVIRLPESFTPQHWGEQEAVFQCPKHQTGLLVLVPGGAAIDGLTPMGEYQMGRAVQIRCAECGDGSPYVVFDRPVDFYCISCFYEGEHEH